MRVKFIANLIICVIISLFDMTKKKESPRTFKYKTAQDFLKAYPKPPPEHAYELKMEKRVKRMIKEDEQNKK